MLLDLSGILAHLKSDERTRATFVYGNVQFCCAKTVSNKPTQIRDQMGVWVAGRREVTQRKISGLQQPRRKTRARSSGCPLPVGPTRLCGDAKGRTEDANMRRASARTQNGSLVCVACLLEGVLPPKNTVPHLFLGLGLFLEIVLGGRG